jgi:HAD superfamily hydrolase (TIGR01509 family)
MALSFSAHSSRWMPTRGKVLRRTVAARSSADSGHLRLTTLLLDLGGVVVPTLFEVIDDPTFPSGPFGKDELYAGVENGHLQERDYWARLADARPDLDIQHFMRTRLQIRDEIRTMLADVGSRIRVAALTNDMAHWFGPEWPMRFAELSQFDLLLEAGRSGVLKPDPAVFRWALSALHERAERCLFVDDLTSNLRGARAVGMEVEHFAVGDPAGSVRRILQRFGITPSTLGSSRIYRTTRTERWNDR